MTTPNLPARAADVDPNVERLLGFFTPASVAAAYEKNGFDVNMLTSILVEIATGTDTSGREKLAALKMLKDGAKEALEVSSIMQKLVATAQRQLPDGSTQTISAEVSRIRRSAEETQRLLETGIIQAQLVESKEESLNERNFKHGSGIPEGDVASPAVDRTERTAGAEPYDVPGPRTGAPPGTRLQESEVIDAEFTVSDGRPGPQANGSCSGRGTTGSGSGSIGGLCQGNGSGPDDGAAVPQLPNFDTEFLKLSGARSPTSQSRVNVDTGDAFGRIRGDGTL